MKKYYRYNHQQNKMAPQEGSALAMAVMFMGLLTAASIMMLVSGQNTRSQTKQTVARTASYYAMQAAQSQARAYLNQYINDRMKQAYDSGSFNGSLNGASHYFSSTNYVNNKNIRIKLPSESGAEPTNSFFTPLETSSLDAWYLPSSGASAVPGDAPNASTMEYQFQQEMAFDTTPGGSASNLTSEIKGKAARKSEVTVLFFNDKNDNLTRDAGEESFNLLKYPTSAGAEQTYTYGFTMTAIGEGMGQRRKSITKGVVTFGLKRPSFAQYGLFMEQASNAWFGKQDVIDGPAHLNTGNMKFVAEYNNNPTSAHFKGKFTSVNSKIDWAASINNSWKLKYDDDPALTNLNPTGTVTGGAVIPTFDNNMIRNVPPQNIPANATEQERVAITGSNGTTAMTEAEKATALGTTAPVPDGIYVPKDGSNNLTGGIYVDGDADSVTLSVDGSDRQVITIRRGTSGAPTEHKQITFDKTTNQTLVKDLITNSTTTLNGVGKEVVHVSGKIKSLGGPPRDPANSNDPDDAPPAIQKDSAFTLAASGEIVLDRDIKYSEDPRGADGEWGGNDDNLEAKNMLGLYSGAGKMRIAYPSPDEMTLHASLMAKQEFEVTSIGSRPNQGNIHVLGGTIQKTVSATSHVNGSGAITNGYGTDFSFDRRFTTNSPPYFPSTSQPFEVTAPTIQYIDWRDVNSEGV